MDKQLFRSYILLLALLLLPGCSADEGVTALMFAAKEGNKQRVAELLDSGAKVDRQSQYGWTALIFAAHYGHIEIVRQLLKRGADVNHTSREIPTGFMATQGGYDSTTALREAIRNSHFDIANLLLDSGATANYKSLDVAAASGDISLIKKMMRPSLDLNDVPEKIANSPLNSAAEAGDVAMMRYLIAQGADVNMLPWNDNMPLCSAIQSSNPEAVKLLLEKGADPNVPKACSGIFSPLREALYPAKPVVELNPPLDKMYRILELLFKYGAGDNASSEEYQEYIATAEKGVAHNLEWSQKPELPQERVERYKAKVAYWRKVLALLKKEQAALSKRPTQPPAAA